MTTYYAASKMNDFIAMFREGLRDLTNPALSPFYTGLPEVPDSELGPRFEASQEFRLDNGFPSLSEPSFAAQLRNRDNQNNFGLFVSEMGIEASYSEDLYEEVPDDTIPALGVLSEVIQTLVNKGYSIDVEGLAEDFPEADLTPEPVMHILSDSPSIWGEEDPVVAAKIARWKRYVSLYMEGGQS